MGVSVLLTVRSQSTASMNPTDTSGSKHHSGSPVPGRPGPRPSGDSRGRVDRLEVGAVLEGRWDAGEDGAGGAQRG